MYLQFEKKKASKRAGAPLRAFTYSAKCENARMAISITIEYYVLHVTPAPSENEYRLWCLIREPTSCRGARLKLGSSLCNEKDRLSFGSGAYKQNLH